MYFVVGGDLSVGKPMNCTIKIFKTKYSALGCSSFKTLDNANYVAPKKEMRFRS